jgi:hypothetical protein
MRESERCYLKMGSNRVVPETPFEVDVIRQAILADKWWLIPERRPTGVIERDFLWDFLLLTRGGQAVLHTGWSPLFVVHYELGDHLEDGFFDLSVKFFETTIETTTHEPVAGFSLLAALRFREGSPPFPTGWKGTRREKFLIPSWFLVRQRANPVNLELRQGEFGGALMIAALVPFDQDAESHCLPPHVQLVDPATISRARANTTERSQ